MKYYKFNRDQSVNALFKYKNSWRKIEYHARRNKLRILDSFYFENQTWGALHKAWKGYVIAKNKDEFDRLEYYASVIRKLQKELGLEVSSFPDLGLMAPEDINDSSECGFAGR
jgi:hypothetical protein